MFDQLGSKDDYARASELEPLTANERLMFFESDGWPISGRIRAGHIMVGGVCRQEEPEILYKATSVRDRKRVCRLATSFENTWITWYWLSANKMSGAPDVAQTT